MPSTSSNIHRLLPWLCLAFLTLAALLLRLYRLPDIGLWYDEAFSVLIARRPWAAMNQAIFSDVHPPLYYYVLHLWGAESITWARGFSVFCGTLAIPLFFVLTRRLLGNVGALLACAILAVHPLHVYYSQEVRMYALLILMIILLLSVALRIIRADAPPKPWHWGALMLLAWAIMATQYLGATVAGGVWAGLLASQIRRDSRPNVRWLLAWFGSGAITLLGIAPFLLWGTRWGMVTNFESEYPLHLLILRDLMDGLEGHIHSAPWTFFGWRSGEFIWDLSWVLPLLALHLGGAFLLSRSNRRAEGIFLLAFLLVCTLLLALYQAAGLRFYTRYYVLLVPASAMLIATAFTQGPRIIRASLFAVMITMFLSNSIASVRSENRETSMQMVKRMQFTTQNRPLPPILVENIGLALTLKAILPQADIRHVGHVGYQPVEHNLLGENGIAPTWPDAWRGKTVWIVMGGWGNLPETPEALQVKTTQVLQEMGAPKGALRLLGIETALGTFKWSALLEWTPQ